MMLISTNTFSSILAGLSLADFVHGQLPCPSAMINIEAMFTYIYKNYVFLQLKSFSYTYLIISVKKYQKFTANNIYNFELAR